MQIAAEAISKMPRADREELLLLLEERERRQAQRTRTVIGFVSPDGKHIHSLKQNSDKWAPTKDAPDLYLPSVMERVVRSNKRFIVLIGGRGSAKSISVADLVLMDARDNRSKTYCLREYQSSIRNSVHSLLKDEIDRHSFADFDVLQHTITYQDVPVFEFAGLARNVDSLKSAHGFKRFWVEEAQLMSHASMTALTPTARAKPNRGLPGDLGEAIDESNVSIVFIANPASSEDPFSKRFIAPYLEHLERDGYYEDDLHLIVVVNYTDNPWFQESGLEQERSWDYENLPRALYDHIWLGKFNDSVESSLVLAEWFDACVDAHKRLGFEPRGAKIAAHDPSDEGSDSKGYAMRHGSVILDVEEKTDGNVNAGGHWASDIAISQQVDVFLWDGDGMGAALAEQMGRDFKDKHTKLEVFRGSEGPDAPTAIYKPSMESPVAFQRTNKDVFRNKRAQGYFELRDRVYRTYRAVVHGEYHDPEMMISFSSEMPLLSKLRAEICRIPVKPNRNGQNELYTKEDMKRLFKVASPNLADSVMMTLPSIPVFAQTQASIPRPIKVIGRG